MLYMIIDIKLFIINNKIKQKFESFVYRIYDYAYICYRKFSKFKVLPKFFLNKIQKCKCI